MCLYQRYNAKINNKVAIYIIELILPPIRPFDSKCNKLNAKNLWKCIFTASRRASFSYFPKVVLNHEVEGRASPPPSVVNFEHVSRFILLLILLKLNK